MFKHLKIFQFLLFILVLDFLCHDMGGYRGFHVMASDDLGGDADFIEEDILLEKFMYGEEWVTIASKRKQKRRDVPSAVFIITDEDIKNSGVTRLADVFRMAPGMDVVTVDGNSSLVSIRGFAIDTLGVNSFSNLAEFSKRLLVLVDGRAIYNPAFGGVFWEQEPVFLEDIQRIEIIRGPGAALYGANAVNGVINIITKDPESTHGTRAKVTYGTQETLIGSLSYGDSIGKFHYRVTAGYKEDDGFDDGFRIKAIDDFRDFKRDQKINMRGKYKFSEDTDAEIFAGFMDGAQGEQFGGQALFDSRGVFNTETTRDLTRAFFQFRFNKTFSETSSLHFQLYADYTDIDEEDTSATRRNSDDIPRFALDPFEMDVRQYDVELQHSFSLGAKNVITWGVNYRNNQLWSRISGNVDEFNAEIAAGNHAQRFKQEHKDKFGMFLQDDFKIFDNLIFTTGLKIERNNFTGTNLSPRASLVYSPLKDHTFRASYSRAYRTPTFLEDAGFFNIGFAFDENGRKTTPITLFGKVGSDDLRPERLDSFELGYQGTFFDKLDLNLEAYFTRYKNIITFQTTELDNTSRADTLGFEISLKYHVASWLDLYTNYSFINFNAKIADGPFENGSPDDTTPDQKANFGMRFKFNNGISANVDLHYVDKIKIFEQDIDDYLRIDIRLAKTFWDGRGEFSIIGQNLQEDKHAEFLDVEVERSGFMGLEINF